MPRRAALFGSNGLTACSRSKGRHRLTSGPRRTPRPTRSGRDVSDKAGRNYAPKIFEEMEGPGGYTKRKFAEAMERLFNGGKIELEPVGPPSDNKKRIVRLIGSAQ